MYDQHYIAVKYLTCLVKEYLKRERKPFHDRNANTILTKIHNLYLVLTSLQTYIVSKCDIRKGEVIIHDDLTEDFIKKSSHVFGNFNFVVQCKC